MLPSGQCAPAPPLPGHEGKPYFVPIDWGNTALVYRTDLVPEEDVVSLQVFTDPKYQGKISIGDNVDDAYALGFLAIGVTDWTTATGWMKTGITTWKTKTTTTPTGTRIKSWTYRP